EEVSDAVNKLEDLRERFDNIQVVGQREFNPGWHLAIDLRNMLLVSECVAKAALTRTESRGGHTRDDHPSMDPNWRKTLLVCRASHHGVVIPGVHIAREDQVPMREDLMAMLDLQELEKYFTPDELVNHPARRS
ncbi:MAG: succinate dehydrogenase / fumarate reductase, flavoprotein subunit, partial [Mycobacterium sp.]|nr:succinate dehydrogenase / fumarate reductase, flavoprotein subunit [Mycobacterium sp.]